MRNGQVDETTNQAVIGGWIKKEGTIGVLELKMLLHRKVSRERTMLANIRENVQNIFALAEIILAGDHAILMPRKYFRFPRSLILNAIAKWFLRVVIVGRSLLVTKMSST